MIQFEIKLELPFYSGHAETSGTKKQVLSRRVISRLNYTFKNEKLVFEQKFAFMVVIVHCAAI